jgi:outer membrane protein assembly factor BamE
MNDHIVTPQSMTAKHHFAPVSLRTTARLLGACLLASMLAACGTPKGQAGSFSASSFNPVTWFTPYRVDVIQGNFVSREQVAQLRPGLTREQVKSVMGTPLLASLFHADRWDYVFTLQRQGVPNQSYNYTVYFTGDQLVRFEGDVMPSEADFIDQLDTSKRKFGKVPVLEATEAQLKAADKTSASRAATAATSPATIAPQTTEPVNYPPLESPR